MHRNKDDKFLLPGNVYFLFRVPVDGSHLDVRCRDSVLTVDVYGYSGIIRLMELPLLTLQVIYMYLQQQEVESAARHTDTWWNCTGSYIKVTSEGHSSLAVYGRSVTIIHHLQGFYLHSITRT